MAGKSKQTKEQKAKRDENIDRNGRLYTIVQTKLNRDPEKIKALLDQWFSSYEWLENISEEEASIAKRFLAEVVVQMIEERKI